MSRDGDPFVRYLGASRDRVVGFSRGASALYVALEGLGVGPGKEVLLTGYTCVVVANSVKFLGATCRYVDIDPRTYGTDADAVASAMNERTAAVIVQHTFGIPARVDRIVAAAAERNVPVIEDCALSLGSRLDDRVVGSFGIAAFWSGQWSKPLPSGTGGYLAVHDPALLERVREQWARAPEPPLSRDLSKALQVPLRRFVLTSSTKAKLQAAYRSVARRGTFGNLVTEAPLDECRGIEPDGYVARVGRAQYSGWRRGIADWHRDIAHRAKIVRRYEEALPKMGFETVTLEPGEVPVYSRYPVRIANKESVIRSSEEQGIEIGDWMTGPLHQSIGPTSTWDYVEGSCPHGEEAGRTVINLPTHRRVSESTAERVLRFVDHFAEPVQ